MPHDGTGAGWDITLPTDSDFRKDGPVEIRDLRKGVAIRANKEHVTYAAASAGGEHKAGSAKIYFIDDGSADPTNRPDGATPLDSNDDGRLLFKDGTMHPYRDAAADGWGTGTDQVKGSVTVGTSFSARFVVGRPFRTVAFHATGATGVCFVLVCGTLTDNTGLVVACLSASGNTVTYEIDTRQTSGNFDFRIKSTGHADGEVALRWHVIF